MKVETREWVRYAEEDWTVATILMRRRKSFLGNSVGFHCQQCVEKYLKARLVEAGVAVPKIHDLQVLLNLVVPLEPLWAAFDASLGMLTGYAVKFRYPGNIVNRTEAKWALKTCRSIREEIRRSLGLPKK